YKAQEFGGFTFMINRRMTILEINNLGFNLNLYTEADQNAEHQQRFTALLRECDDLNELRFRVRHPGDAYIPAQASRAIKLKTLMIRRKIPLTQRDKYPILVTKDDRIVWAPGLPVAREYAPEPGQEYCALIIAEKPPDP